VKGERQRCDNNERAGNDLGGTGRALPKWLQALLTVAVGGVALLAGAIAHAQGGYPEKPLRIIVAYTPAGTTDIIARAIGKKFTAAWGQPLIVDNRPGANGNIGTEVAARAAPDGYVLLMGTVATHAFNPGLYPQLPYDAINDFAPISLVATVPNIVVVQNALPVMNLKELIAHAKKNPGKLAFGLAGNASIGHLSSELFKTLAGIDMAHVAYKGSASTLRNLLGGQVQVVIDRIPPYLAQIKAGKIRALAVTGSKRSPVAPQLPTVAEAGVKGYDAAGWFGLFAPAGAPAEIVAKISGETQRIVNLPDIRELLLGLGAQPVGNSPQEFARFVQDEITKWGKVIRSANVTPER